MSIQKDLEKEGIEVIGKLDTLIANDISKSISRRIIETFPNYDFTEEQILNKLTKLTMYRAKMIEGMAEANYFYKNTSIYFNEHIAIEDLEEFAIHECIHYLQEIKDENNNLLKMGLCTYNKNKTTGLGLNEAAVQLTTSHIIGIDSDFEKYYGISLNTPSPSYYPLECSLLNEISYFTGKDVLYKSTLFSTNEFRATVEKFTSEHIYNTIQKSFDTILKFEETLIKLNNKMNLYEDGSPKIDKLNNKITSVKEKIANKYIVTQNLIIKEFFDYEFSQISNLEQLETFRHRIYKFSDIIGSVENYKYFDNYYIEMMNKLEHKCNILENGGTETALSSKSKNFISKLFHKILNWAKKETIF